MIMEKNTLKESVSYSSPFIGTTKPVAEVINKYGATRQSYGFWMTPPDVDTNVICIFINGSPDQGYYIGCIPDMTGHHMVPAIAGSAVADVESFGA